MTVGRWLRSALLAHTSCNVSVKQQHVPHQTARPVIHVPRTAARATDDTLAILGGVLLPRNGSPLMASSSADELQEPPADLALRSKIVYRVWIYTSNEDPAGEKGDVSLCLHGPLGSVWLQQLQSMALTNHGGPTVFGCATGTEGHPIGGGGRCELYVSAQDVGAVHRLTVAYAHDTDEKRKKPWRLSQVLIRHGGDCTVTVFPADSAELRPPEALLELMPRLSWHEDMFGNISEAAPPLPPTGQWHWPASARFDVAIRPGAHDDLARASEQEAFQMKLFNAILSEEILPLADQAAHDVAMMRTPGSFLHGCTECVAGTVLGSAASIGAMDELRRYSVGLQKQVDTLSGMREAGEAWRTGGRRTELEVAKEHVRKLTAENAALRDADGQNRHHLERLKEEKQQADAAANGGSKLCAIS